MTRQFLNTPNSDFNRPSIKFAKHVFDILYQHSIDARVGVLQVMRNKMIIIFFKSEDDRTLYKILKPEFPKSHFRIDCSPMLSDEYEKSYADRALAYYEINNVK